MKRAGIDMTSVVAGVLTAGFGVVLLLDATGVLALRFAGYAPLAALLVGATLLASGLNRHS